MDINLAAGTTESDVFFGADALTPRSNIVAIQASSDGHKIEVQMNVHYQGGARNTSDWHEVITLDSGTTGNEPTLAYMVWGAAYKLVRASGDADNPVRFSALG